MSEKVWRGWIVWSKDKGRFLYHLWNECQCDVCGENEECTPCIAMPEADYDAMLELERERDMYRDACQAYYDKQVARNHKMENLPQIEKPKDMREGLLHLAGWFDALYDEEKDIEVSRDLRKWTADYDALQARVVECDGDPVSSDASKVSHAIQIELLQARIATLEAELAQKAAKCETLNEKLIELESDAINTELQNKIRDKFLDALGPDFKGDIDGACSDAGPWEFTLLEISQGIGHLCEQRDTALADLATAREECKALKNSLALYVELYENSKNKKPSILDGGMPGSHGL